MLSPDMDAKLGSVEAQTKEPLAAGVVLFLFRGMGVEEITQGKKAP